MTKRDPRVKFTCDVHVNCIAITLCLPGAINVWLCYCTLFSAIKSSYFTIRKSINVRRRLRNNTSSAGRKSSRGITIEMGDKPYTSKSSPVAENQNRKLPERRWKTRASTNPDLPPLRRRRTLHPPPGVSICPVAGIHTDGLLGNPTRWPQVISRLTNSSRTRLCDNIYRRLY